MIFSAIAAGLAAMGLSSSMISLAFTIGSMAYQNSRANKLKREQDKRKQVAVAVDGEPFYPSIVYGRGQVSGGKTLHKLKDSLTFADSPQASLILSSNLSASKSGSKNEYLVTQQAICYGPINRIVDVTVDDKDWDDSTLTFGQRLLLYYNGGIADPLAIANGVPSTNYFTNLANATCVFRLNRDEYNYSGSPNVSFFVEGIKVKDIVLDGGVYSLSVSTSFSTNPALILLDYLLSTVYGKGVPLSSIDLKSFYEAKQLCDRVVKVAAPVTGRVNGRRPDKENEDGTITTQPQVPPRDIKLYECNITLDSERPIRENVELILESMEESELIWSGGQYKLSLAAPTSSLEQQALVVATLSEDDILRETVELSWPDASTRYNQVTVRFRSELEDFKDDTVTWPATLSTVHTAYLAEDSQQQLKTELYLPCTCNPYHALAKAEQVVRLSRRAMTAKMTVGKIGLLLEPGDIVVINSPTTGLMNELMKVTSVTLSSDLTAELELVQYDYTTFAWNVSDDIAYSEKKLYFYGVVSPRNVEFSSTVIGSMLGVSSGRVLWSYPNDVSVSEFLVELSADNGTTWQVVSSTLATSVDLPPLNNGVYKFSVRSKTSNGRYSPRVLAKNALDQESFTLQRKTTDQVAIIYADTQDALTNEQTYSATGKSFVAYVVYAGDTPTLPIRTDIVFSKFVAEDSLSVTIEIREKPVGVDWNSALSTSDPETWPHSSAGSVFRNNTGSTKALVAFVAVGETTLTAEEHRALSYSWLQGDSIFIPTVVGANRLSRWVPVTAADVLADSQFICEISKP